MTRTFTYEHPLYYKAIQHQVIGAAVVKVEGGVIDIAFKDEKDRHLHIVTNTPFVLREEPRSEDRPEMDPETEYIPRSEHAQ